MVHINDLPRDVLTSILDNIDFGDLRSTLLVGKAWNEASYCSKLWNGNKRGGESNKLGAFLHVWGHPDPKDVVKVLNKIGKVKSMFFEHDPTPILKELSKTTFTFEELFIGHSVDTSVEFLSHVPQTLKWLFMEVADKSKKNPKTIAIPPMPNLSVLKISTGKCSLLDLTRVPNLKRLWINALDVVVFPPTMPHLECLSLYGLAADSCTSLNAFPVLKQLRGFEGNFTRTMPTLEVLKMCNVEPEKIDALFPNIIKIKSTQPIAGWATPGLGYHSHMKYMTRQRQM